MSEPLPTLPGAEPPPELLAFDGLVSAPHPPADFRELSIGVSHRLDPWRLTAYFDVAGEPTVVTRTAWERASALAEFMGVPLPAVLESLLCDRLATNAALRQVAVGLDARDDPAASRMKLYVIFEGDASRPTASLCAALDATPPDNAALALTHIVGIDLTRAGLHDVKLYYSLDLGRAHRIVRDPTRWTTLLRGATTLVYAHSLLTPRRSLHVRARDPELLWRELPRLAAPALPRLHACLQALGCTPDRRGPLQPAFVALPWEDGALDPTRFTLYLHPRRARLQR